MRRSIGLLFLVTAFVAIGAVPAGAVLEEINVDPGVSVEVIDGIYIKVETNGDVFVIDGIFVQKLSDGGQPTEVTLDNGRMILTVIPGGCLDPKLCL